MHSFRVHTDGTVTWTLKHETMLSKPEPKPKGTRGQAETATNDEPSKRELRSRARGLRDWRAAGGAGFPDFAKSLEILPL